MWYLKAFLCTNAQVKTNCSVVKTLWKKWPSQHRWQDKNAIWGAQRNSDWIKTETVPLGGRFSENSAQKPLIHTRNLKRKPNRAALAEGCTLDPYSLPSSLKGPCSRLCWHMRSKKHFENQENHLMLKFLINHS